MDYIEKKSTEDMLKIIIHIEKYLLDDDYGNAFLMFLLQSERMTSLDREQLIKHFNKYFRTKFSVKK